MLLAACAAASAFGRGLVVSVSPDGKTKTLDAAVETVRGLRANGQLGRDEVATIEVADGVYRLSHAVELDARDANLVICAKNRGKAVLSGALPLTWRKVGSAAPPLVPAAARGHLLVADILGEKPIPGFAGGEGAHSRPDLTDASLALFQGESRLPVARYPNEGFVYTGEILGTNNMAKIGGAPVSHDGRFRFYDRAKLDVWAKEPDLWAFGYWHFLWADHRAKVVSVKPAELEIAVDNRQDTYGFVSNQQFYVFNALSELDRAGEWALDRKSRRVFVWPKDGELGEPYMAETETLVSVRDVANVVFDGLVFECSRRDALVFRDTSNVTVRASLVRHTGMWAVRYEGGRGGRVAGCDMHDIGEGGVYLRGGDHDTLSPGRHEADNNHIHHYGRVTPNSRPAVRLEGVGNRATHNLIHNSNHQAISFDGNDHYIGFNVCHDICEYNLDAGAIYGYMLDWSKRGTVIEYNVIHVVGKQPFARGCSGVYLDAYTSGVTVRHNIFSQIPDGVFINGGQDNLVYDNVFLNCRRSLLRFTLGGCTAYMKHCWGLGRKSQLFKSLLGKLNLYKSALWASRYPKMLRPLDFADVDLPRAHDALWCVVTNNVAYASGPISYTCHKETGPYTTFSDNSIYEPGKDPGFVDYFGFDWNLRPDSELLPRIGQTRFGEMGLYSSSERLSPAVRHGEGMLRPRGVGMHVIVRDFRTVKDGECVNFNIGTAAHCPSTVSQLLKFMPDTKVTIWADAPLSEEMSRMMHRRFPDVPIVCGAYGPKASPELKAAVETADALLVASSSGLSGKVLPSARDFRRASGRTIGCAAMGTANPAYREFDFGWFRDERVLAYAEKRGDVAPIHGYAPDSVFYFDCTDEDGAEKFLASNGLKRGEFVCAIPGNRVTPRWEFWGGRPDEKGIALNAKTEEPDNAVLRMAIVEVVRRHGLKVLVCPEQRTEVALGKRAVIDRLPEDVRPFCVWTGEYWSPDLALSVYKASRLVFGVEMHSQVMALGNGIPAVILVHPNFGTKDNMWRTIGCDAWRVDITKEGSGERAIRVVSDILSDEKTARAKVAAARSSLDEKSSAMFASSFARRDVKPAGKGAAEESPGRSSR